MPTIRVNGVDLYYEQHGDTGPWLILAHGLMGSIALTPSLGGEDAAAWAAKGLRVIAYDARGHGRSGYTRNRRDYRWRALGDDMHALIRALGIERASVYGGSMGCGTALCCALDHPETIDRLILQSPPPLGMEAMAPVRRLFAPLATSYRLFGVQATAWMASRRVPLDGQTRAGLRAFFAAQRRASIVPAIRGVLLDQHQLPYERFGEIEHPTLVLAHPDDVLHPMASAEYLHEHMRHAKLAVAPTSTYWRENAAALSHVVWAFVKGETIAAGLPEKSPHGHG